MGISIITPPKEMDQTGILDIDYSKIPRGDLFQNNILILTVFD